MNRRRILLAIMAAAFALAAMLWRAGPAASRSGARVSSGEKSVPVWAPSLERIAGKEAGKAADAAADVAELAGDPKVRQTLSRLLSVGRTRGQISRPVLEDFVASADRRATALLVAWREIEDSAYLEEAAERFPEDPRVQFAMIT